MESARPIAMWMWRMGRGLGPAGGPRAQCRGGQLTKMFGRTHILQTVYKQACYTLHARSTVICDSTETHADAQ